MNKATINLGLWSAILCAATFIAWVVSFTGIAVTSPLFTWSNLQDYEGYIHTYPQFFQYLSKSSMIVFALAFVALLMVFHTMVPGSKKIIAGLAVILGAFFSLSTAIHYFVQVSAVRFAFETGQTDGIVQFLMANPYSALMAINMLGWTLFLGLSTLFMGVSLKGSEAPKVIRITLLINGIACLLAGLGYLARIDIITFVCLDLGMGGALLVMTLASSFYFIKIKRQDMP